MEYAQLEFTESPIKRVTLIGGNEVGIIPALIEKYNNAFVNLEGRENRPLDNFNWYYNSDTDTFIHFDELPITEPVPEPEYIPSNTEIYENQMIIMSALADIAEMQMGVQ